MTDSTRRMKTGLVSVTFRKLPCERVVELAAAAKLDAIEWGGDVHVPHGDLDTARRVRRLCADAGVGIFSYGSYYRAAAEGVDFSDVLETALALGAPSIRVWAGTVDAAIADATEREQVAADMVRICDLAAAAGVRVTTEFHGGTLTSLAPSARALMEAVNRENLRTYWQPRHGQPVEAGVADLELLRPYLGDLHVFHWWPDQHARHPLRDGVERWRTFLTAAAQDGKDRVAALEFVRGDDERQFMEDAATLHELVRGEGG